MKYTTFLCACSILLLGSCKKQPVQNEQPLEVMTFNIRLVCSFRTVPTTGNTGKTMPAI